MVWISPPLSSSREERENGRLWRRSDPRWEQETDANAMELLCCSSSLPKQLKVACSSSTTYKAWADLGLRLRPLL